MVIGGFQKVSLIDYPGKIASVVFFRGCNFRCSYCHNPELVLPGEYANPIDENEIFDYLKKRVSKIDAVVVSGGEPTLQQGLGDFIIKVKAMGYLVKLDTNGTNPDVIAGLLDLQLVDYIAMDVKAPYEKYSAIACAPVNIRHIQESIEVIISSGIPHEFRTTVVKTDLNTEDMKKIGDMIKDAQTFALQEFNPSQAIDKTLIQLDSKPLSFSKDDLNDIREYMKRMVANCQIR